MIVHHRPSVATGICGMGWNEIHIFRTETSSTSLLTPSYGKIDAFGEIGDGDGKIDISVNEGGDGFGRKECETQKLSDIAFADVFPGCDVAQ